MPKSGNQWKKMRKRPGMRKPCGRNDAIIAIQEEQGRGNDERKTKMRQTSGSCFFFCRGSQMGRKLEKMQVASRMRFALTSSDEGGEIGLRYGAERYGANLGQDSVDPR